jgi:predicted transposase YbfD/YdcC
MEPNNNVTIADHFSTLTDPRVEGRTDHKLIDIITIAICAVVCGADNWVEIESYGKSKKDWFKSFLELQNGIPTHHTFRRLFMALSQEEFETCFIKWVQSFSICTLGRVIPIDGKTLRRSHDRSTGKSPIHMVNAWCSENRICLGQVKTSEKSNEITAIPELIKRIEVNNCIVTIDAMGCQTHIAETIVKEGGDYILALKGNQGNLSKDVELFFQDAVKRNFKDIPFDSFETIDGDHGRIETRKIKTTTDIGWLYGKEKWSNLNTIIMIESERDDGSKISRETRYYISSMKDSAENLLKAIRSHWGVENSLHWVQQFPVEPSSYNIRGFLSKVFVNFFT